MVSRRSVIINRGQKGQVSFLVSLKQKGILRFQTVQGVTVVDKIKNFSSLVSGENEPTSYYDPNHIFIQN